MLLKIATWMRIGGLSGLLRFSGTIRKPHSTSFGLLCSNLQAEDSKAGKEVGSSVGV
jgi:hypothetical protein